MTNIAIVRDYETLYIIDPNLTEEQVQAVTDKYSQIVTQNGGEILAVEKWDRRRLAYEVAGKREGMYILMYFRSEATVASELDRLMKINEDVLRHLIVRDEEGQAAAAKERVSRPAPKPAEQPVEAKVEEAPAQAEAETPAEAEATAETAQPEEAEPAAAEPVEEQPTEAAE
ncbi:MAG: 30S ribosomal protein S6 [Armatimonadota bacterium]